MSAGTVSPRAWSKKKITRQRARVSGQAFKPGKAHAPAVPSNPGTYEYLWVLQHALSGYQYTFSTLIAGTVTTYAY